MHKSLSPRANRTLIFVYTSGLAALIIATGTVVLAFCLIGAVFGVAAGVLQRRVLQTHARAFALTATAMDVRRVLTSSRTGTVAIFLTWVCGAVLLVIALIFVRPTSTPASWFAGFLAFVSLRDTNAYSTLRFVQASSPDRGALP